MSEDKDPAPLRNADAERATKSEADKVADKPTESSSGGHAGGERSQGPEHRDDGEG